MAFTEFYMQNTGSNLNAGSTNADAASVTSTNGSWDITANTFIATGGTPFSGVSVGDWVSIYNDGASVTPHVAQVTAIYLSGLGVEVSATVKFGTKPASGATGKSCKVGGAWADLGMLASGVALNTGTTPVAMRLNLKVHTSQPTSGYANTTTTRTWSLVGTATLPIWIRGYASAIGDLETDWSTAPPLIEFTTGQWSFNASHLVVSNISITSAATAAGGAVTTGSSSGVWFDRIRIENTASNSASRAISLNGSTNSLNRLTRCWFKATATADGVVVIGVAGSDSTIFEACYITGGVVNFKSINSISHTIVMLNCLLVSPTTYCIQFTSAATALGLVIVGNTLYGGSGTDGIRLDFLPTFLSVISNNIIANCSGYGINNSTGTAGTTCARFANHYYAISGTNENGFGDHPSFGDTSDASSPFTNSAGGDFSLTTGADAIAAGSPGQFENTSLIGYMDCGAMQKQATGGGGIIGGPNLQSGLQAC